MPCIWRVYRVLLLSWVCFYSLFVFGQDQKVADSLAFIYKQDILEGTDKLELLRNLSFNELNNIELAIRYANELIEESAKQRDDIYLYRGYHLLGNKQQFTGDLDQALGSFFKSAEIAKRADYLSGEGKAFIGIGDVYSVMGNSYTAVTYYNKSIRILRQMEDSLALASALTNAGDLYFTMSKYDSALMYFEEAGTIFSNLDYRIGNAYSLGNIGMVYAEQNNDVLAEHNINEAVAILEELKDYYPISVYLTYMADIYLRQNDIKTALDYASRSLKLATQYNLKKQISEAHFKLAELYEVENNPIASYAHFKDYIAYRDSVRNIETVQQMADLRTDYEVAQKQIEVDLQKKNQRIIIAQPQLLLY